jgi:hypothetical protein
MTTGFVRRLGSLTEALHAVVYFAPEPQGRYAALGLRGYWRGYFASRTAALGRTSPELATAVLGGFAPQMVARALPAVWDLTTPGVVAAARLDGARAALHRLLAGADASRASEALAPLAQRVPLPGRPLAAAHSAVRAPQDAVGLLWHCSTVLREHRGDGHLAAVATAGLEWPQAHVLRASFGDLDARQQEYRGWSDAEWATARDELDRRGLLGTTSGRDLVEQVEAATDELAAPAYRDVDADRLVALLEPLAAKVHGELPFPNAMGLRKPA